MGRHNKRPTTDGDVIDKDHIREGKMNEAAARRLGLYNQICQSCNANNASNANSCRKCGSKQLRRKKRDYADA